MRVVVVDPSRTVLKFIARLLATRNQVRTFVAAREALECVRSDLSVGALITSDELLPMSIASPRTLSLRCQFFVCCSAAASVFLL
jgi:hypothetical protein